MSKLSISDTCAAIVCLALAISYVEARPPSRIANGQDANIEEFPWQAAIVLNNDLICGAAIIGERHIVTAGHCVYDYAADEGADVYISVGSNIIGRGENHRVESIVVHPGFSTTFPLANDIAIMKIAFNKNKRAVALPVSDVPVNATVIASGWGIDITGWQSGYLAKTNLTIMANNDCDIVKLDKNNDDFDEVYDIPLTSGQICGMPAIHSGTCEGDSGGAVVYKGSIIGIVSWSYQCGEGYPNVFTRIYEYVDWIREVMKQ